LFVKLFESHFRRLYRYLDRLSGEPDLAADIAQEACIRLYQRGALPDSLDAWLISVSMNLYRNVRSNRSRRSRLLGVSRGENVLSDPPPAADQRMLDEESRSRVRAALDDMPERDRSLLLLRAEGYAYKDIAAALDLRETSIGTLLARAREAFRHRYEASHAP
jgi:RNA polymerase sigma factor (sigma-70 family)